MKKLFPVIAAMVLLAAGPAVAAPADTIAARQQGFKSIGKAFKGVNDELRGGTPSAASVQANARALADLSIKLPGWFPAGTGPEAGVKTGAKPAIWSNPAGFRTAAGNFQKAAANLSTVAAGGNVAAMQAAAKALGATCGGCHDNFRQKDD